MSAPDKAVIEGINSKLDARQVYRAIGFRVESLSQVGPRLKGLCPVHRGETFKSLQLDPQTSTAQCIVKECRAHGTISLVEFYALARHLDPLAAALELARLFSLNIPSANAEEICLRFLALAEAALAVEEYDAAELHLASALAARPGDASLAIRLATVKERSGAVAEALEAWLHAAELADSPAEKLRLIEDEALRLFPENLRALRLASETHRQLFPDDATWRDIRSRCAELSLKNRQYKTVLEELQPLEEVDDQRVIFLKAEALIGLEEMDDALTLLYTSTDAIEQRGSDADTLRLYELLLRLEPDNDDVRERVAEFRALLGDTDTYLREIEKLATNALGREDTARAEHLFQTLLKREIEHPGAHEGLAGLAAEKGDGASQYEHLIAAFTSWEKKKNVEKLVALIPRLRQCVPEDAEQLALLAERAEKLDGTFAAAFWSRAGILLLGQQNRPAAEDFLRRAFALAPGDQQLLRTAIDAAVEASHPDLAATYYLQMAEVLAVDGPVPAAALLDEALERCGRERALLKSRFDLLLRIADVEHLRPALDELLEPCLASERFEEAARMAESALAACPDEPSLLEKLADVHLIAGSMQEAIPLLLRIARADHADLQLRLRAAEQVVEQEGADPATLLLLASLMEQNDEEPRAAVAYEQAADLLSRAADHLAALEAMEKSVALRAGKSDPLRTAAEFALAAGESSRASLHFESWLGLIRNDGSPKAIRAAFAAIAEKLPAAPSHAMAFSEWLSEQGEAQQAILPLLSCIHHLVEGGEIALALPLLDRCLQLDEINVCAYRERAEIHRRLDCIQEAAADWRRVMHLASTMDDPAEAIDACEQLARNGMLAYEEFTTLSELYEQKGNRLEAVRALLRQIALPEFAGAAEEQQEALLRRVLGLDSCAVDVRVRLAEMLLQRQQHGEAAEHFEEAARQLVDQDVDRARELLRCVKDFEPARFSPRELLLNLLRGEDPEAYKREAKEFATFAASQSDHLRSRDILAALASDFPSDAKVLTSLAEVHELLQEKTEAERRFADAASLLEEADELFAAADLLRRILHLDPGKISIRQKLISILRRSDLLEDARVEYMILLAALFEQDNESVAEDAVQEFEAISFPNWSDYEPVLALLKEYSRHTIAIDSLNRLLEHALEEERIPLARIICERILQLDTDNPTHESALAGILLRLGEVDEAENAYLRAVEKTKTNPLSLLRQAHEDIASGYRLHLRLLRELLGKKKSRGEGVEEARRLVAAYNGSQDWEKVREVSQLVMESSGKETEFHFCLAEALFELEKKGEAAEVLRNLASSMELNDPAEARRALENLLDYLPDSADDLAFLHRLVTQSEGELAARPLQARTLNLYAATIHEAGEFQRKADELITADPGNHDLHRRYAELLHERGMIAEARAHFDSLLGRLAKESDFVLQVKVLLSATELFPEDLALLSSLAETQEQGGEPDDAALSWILLAGKTEQPVPALENVLRIDPDNIDVLQRLVEIHRESEARESEIATLHRLVAANERVDRHKENVALLERLLELDEENDALREQFAELLQNQGLLEESLEQRRLHIDLLRRKGRLQEAIASGRRGKDQFPEAPVFSETIVEISGQAGDLRSLAREAEFLAKWHLSQGDAAAALACLSKAAVVLLEQKGERLILEMLGPFGEKTHDVPDLVRIRALALEAEGQEPQAAASWKQLAELHREAENDPEAEIALRRAIALNPRDGELREDLIELLRAGGETRGQGLVEELLDFARLQEGRKNLESASNSYDEALKLDPENREALMRSAGVLVQLGRREDASEAQLLLAALCHRDDDAAAAERAYEEALSLSLENPRALRGLMQLADSRGDQPNYLLFARRLASFYDRHHALEDGNGIYLELCRRDPNDEEARQRLAEYYQQTGETEAAGFHLRELYRLYNEQGSVTSAIDVLQRLEKVDPENPETSELLGRIYIALHDEAQAVSYLMAAARGYSLQGQASRALDISQSVLDIVPRTLEAHDLRVDLFLEGGNANEAARELVAIADYHYEAENLEKELEVLLRILEITPKNFAVLERHALLLSDLDRVEEAANQFLLLSRLLEEAGDATGASDAIATACTLQPDHFEAKRQAADLYLAQSDYLHADAAIEWLAAYFEANEDYAAALGELQRSPSLSRDPGLQLRSARLQKSLEKIPEAKSSVHRALDLAGDREDLRNEAQNFLFELDPGDLRSLHLLVDAAIEEGEPTAVRALYLQSFESILSTGEVEAARSLLQEAAAKTENSPALRQEAALIYQRNGIPELAAAEWVAIARNLLEEGSWEEAISQVETALALRSDDAAALEVKFDALRRLDRSDEAYAVAQHFLRLHPEGPRAESLLQEMIALSPRDVAPRRQLVELLEKRDDKARLAVELRNLADLHLQQEDLQSTADVLARLLQIKPDDTQVRIQYIDTFRRIGPEEKLVDDYLLLASVYARDGCFLEATRLYEKMRGLVPDRKDIHEKFIHFLVDNGQATRAVSEAYLFTETAMESGDPRAALGLLEKVRIHAEGEPHLHSLLGRIHLLLNARGMAAKELRRAAELHREGGNLEQQAIVLADLLKIDPLNLEIRQALIDALINSENMDDALEALDELGARYLERGLADLAEVQLRRAISIDSQRPSTWRLLFVAAQSLVAETELVQDYLDYAEMMARMGNIQEAIDYYIKVIGIDPRNLRAHRGHVSQYPKVGKLKDIGSEILAFAQLLVEEGEVDEAVRYFELVMSFDPENTVARDMLSATQSRATSPSVPKLKKEKPETRPGEDSTFDSTMLSETQKSFIRSRTTVSASDYLAGEIQELDHAESSETLGQVVANYRHILAVNAQAANVRVKLADVLEQMGRIPDMLAELEIASETCFSKSELSHCIRICERYLELKPTDGRMRRRLNEAIVKQDAIKALESAILYTNRETTQTSEKPGV